MRTAIDGPYQPQKGLLFDRNKVLLDPYARAVTGQGTWGVRQNKHVSCPGGQGYV